LKHVVNAFLLGVFIAGVVAIGWALGNAIGWTIVQVVR